MLCSTCLLGCTPPGVGASSDACWASELAEHTFLALPSPTMVALLVLRGQRVVCHACCVVQICILHHPAAAALHHQGYACFTCPWEMLVHTQQADAVNVCCDQSRMSCQSLLSLYLGCITTCCQFASLLCRAFQAWADKVAHKKSMREKLMSISQLLMHGSLARCFQAWHQDAQVCIADCSLQRVTALRNANRDVQITHFTGPMYVITQ